MTIETKELVISEELKRKVEMICRFDYADYEFIVRLELGVENNLHAPLDIIFKENNNKKLDKNKPKNLGINRRIALSLLKFVQA